MANSQYEIEILITGDGQVKASIAGLTKGLQGLTTVTNLLRESQEENNAALVGTNKYYKEQIKLAEEVRDRTAKNSKEYTKATQEIDALRVAQQTLTNETMKAQAPREGTLAYYRKEIELLRQEQSQVADNNKTWQDYEQRINSVKDKMAGLTDSTRMSAKPNQDLISSAGLAGATLTEFGRVISDANYGIRGIANNLSQLSFLFITLVSKTESAAAAFKLLWKQLMGPLGIILAFQTVISVLEGVSIAKEKSARGSNNLKGELDKETLALVELHKAAMAYAEGSIERERAVANLAKANKELDNIYRSQALSQEEINDLMATTLDLKLADVKVSAAANDLADYAVKVDGEVIERQERITSATKDLSDKKRLLNEIDAEGNSGSTIALNLRGEIRALDNSIAIQTEELNKINTERNKIIARYNAALEEQAVLSAKAVADSPRTVAWYENQIEIIRNYQKNIATTSEQFQNAEKAVKLFQDQIDLLAGKESTEKISTLARDLADELAIINKDRFDAQRIQAEQEYRDTLEKIEKEKLSRKEAEEARVLAAQLRKEKINKINEEEKQYDLDLTEKAIKESQNLEEKFEKDKEKASKDLLDRIDKEALKATNAAKKVALESIKDKKLLQAEFNRIDQENIRTQIALINAVVAAGSIGAEVGMEAIEKLNAKLVSLGLSSADSADKPEEFDPKKALDAAREVFNAGIEAAQAALDAELSIEEAKTAKLNNELRKRLDNENLSAEQRKQINDQIAKNEELLQIKRDKIAEKAFKLQKTLSIANTLISTYEMAVSAYSALAKIPIVGPALGSAAATAATLFGLKQVDAISRQQFVPSAVGGRGDSGATSAIPIQAPDFNVVGQSQTSQLAALVQGQLDKPVKTYVVASDVTTAQELERKRISAATI